MKIMDGSEFVLSFQKTINIAELAQNILDTILFNLGINREK
jgi:hypothetical protein